MLRLALRLHWLIHLKASETLALKLWHHHLGQKNGLKTEIKSTGEKCCLLGKDFLTKSSFTLIIRNNDMVIL